ncbi:hypothetical protein J3T65_01480 [Staphylococcus simiae]|uniref:hypothetical protein n=1 Tax=Staphylococcus simiae TaxID=308354 RepID=UPI001A96312B|nr:hypothetical protein [Staphylococcus simiae]MBO1198219.1 hypothetical protein [Staphylococcus simiae]MBO1200237.1 hypothetical protein [Staphylococcus simiae]MBO1202599.1 hypothetical protein [Staphylococcus simiae]MBO1210123.1 hypothetical protein [Staphylococcus simiae]MBO1228743.1 hypothetical protein [Staphylococcus simiae]
MYLKWLYHSLAAIVISLVLLLSTAIIDRFNQGFYLNQLLLNIDFIANPADTPYIIEVLLHLALGLSIYVIFVFIYRYVQHFYLLCYGFLFIVFLVLYPLLIVIAVRPIFQFNMLAWLWWVVCHILFMWLMMMAISMIEKQNKRN